MGSIRRIPCKVPYKEDILESQGFLRMTCKPYAHIAKSPNGLAAYSRSCSPIFLAVKVPLVSFGARSSPSEYPLEVLCWFVVTVEYHGQALFGAS
jgi:hypothetical protein